ncbi:hypothetical protein NDU88_005162 [Pleurodeles waltl]|uniref:Uncharacterized protein n=1 Tax=Pleurodeles waltl TaxID=8319 RepID=A0AAV7KZW9_PLEWA|nr:hypothetical protein NDU88_005162 [Pleurodeles waltl]
MYKSCQAVGMFLSLGHNSGASPRALHRLRPYLSSRRWSGGAGPTHGNRESSARGASPGAGLALPPAGQCRGDPGYHSSRLAHCLGCSSNLLRAADGACGNPPDRGLRATPTAQTTPPAPAPAYESAGHAHRSDRAPSNFPRLGACGATPTAQNHAPIAF